MTDFAVLQVSNFEPGFLKQSQTEHSKWAMVTEHQLGTQTILQLACTLQGEQMTFVAKQETKSCSK